MKKLSTIVITAMTGALSLTALNTNAAIWRTDDLSEEHQALIGTQDHIDYSGYDFINEYYSSDYAGYKIFNYDEVFGMYFYIGVDSRQFSLKIDPLADPTAAEETLYAELDKMGTEYKVQKLVDEYRVSIADVNYNTLLNARIICNELKSQGLITEFYYHGDHYSSVTTMESPYLTSYWYASEEEAETITTALQSLIDKYDLDWHILRADEPASHETEDPYTGETITTDGFYKDPTDTIPVLFKQPHICLVPNVETSPKEQSELAQLVLDELGFSANAAFNQSMDVGDIDMYNIDLLNLKYGDLDSDGTVNALDASNILTYYSDSQTGNTDTYTDEDIADITLLGDYDADGAVNALDASLVLKEYAETQTE